MESDRDGNSEGDYFSIMKGLDLSGQLFTFIRIAGAIKPLPGLKPEISDLRYALFLRLLTYILTDYLNLHQAYTFRKVVVRLKTIAPKDEKYLQFCRTFLFLNCERLFSIPLALWFMYF
jgi:hypothetical protein